MEEDKSLRLLATRLVEQVSGLTALICSMEEQIRVLSQDNRLLRQQVQELSVGVQLSQSVLCPDTSTSATDALCKSFPQTIEEELFCSVEEVFVASPSSDPMIYEVDGTACSSQDDESFEKMFDLITQLPEESAVATIPRLNRRMNRRSTGPLRILAVEDDPFCQQLIRHIVNSLNVGQIEVVSDGVDAVINMSTGSFDLILMDIQLPRLDGLQATQSIRKFNRRTPIVSMTSQVTADDLQRYFDGGIDEVLPKPFDRQAVMRVIEQFFKLSVS